MKKIIIVLVLLAMAVSAHAQYATTSLAERKGGSIKIDDYKLSQAEALDLMSNIGGEDYSEQWIKARGGRTAGIAMMAGGGGVTVVGLTTVLIGAVTSMFGATGGAIAGTMVGSIGGQETATQTGQEAAQKGAQAGVPIMNTGGIIALVGFVTSIAGIPVTVVNCKKMSSLVDKYNESLTAPEKEPRGDVLLSFGATANGVGLRLTF